MTEPTAPGEPVEGQPCPVCRLPDPAHDWDAHEGSPPPHGAAIIVQEGTPAGVLTAALPNMLLRSSTRGRYGVRVLALHTTEGILRAQDLRAWASWTGSSHASADDTGALLTPANGFVPYHLAAWTLRSGNPWSENIELCGFASWTRPEWLSRRALLEAAAQWLADRSVARGIPLVKITAQQYRAGASGVIDHDDHTDGYNDGTHWDVGENFPWDVVIPRARAIASGIAEQEEDEVAGPVDLTPAAVAAVARAASDAVANRVVGRMPDGSSMEAWEAWVGGSDAAPVDVQKLVAELVPAIVKALPAGATGTLTAAQLQTATENGLRRVLTEGVAG